MNPDMVDDPDMNFSHAEAVRGYLSPKPVAYRKGDLRLFIDSLGRPDAYAMAKLKRQILYWNQQIAHRMSMIYVYSCEVEEINPATKRREEKRVLVDYDYLRVLRGKDFVSRVEGHIDETIHGLEREKGMDTGFNKC